MTQNSFFTATFFLLLLIFLDWRVLLVLVRIFLSVFKKMTVFDFDFGLFFYFFWVFLIYSLLFWNVSTTPSFWSICLVFCMKLRNMVIFRFWVISRKKKDFNFCWLVLRSCDTLVQIRIEDAEQYICGGYLSWIKKNLLGHNIVVNGICFC